MSIQGESPDYESDPDESSPALTRRAEASDDEEDDVGSDHEKRRRRDVRSGIHSDGDSDGQGAPAVYGEESDAETQQEEEEEELNGTQEEEYEDHSNEEEEEMDEGERSTMEETLGYDEHPSGNYEENQPHNQASRKKENEPFAVPTAGAFYMHDDRFGDNGGARSRRFRGGRRLWESRDDRAWVHDRFEEMNIQDIRCDKERRMRKGGFRGRGRGRYFDRGYTRNNRNRGYENPTHGPKTVRGRGPRRYLPSNNNVEAATFREKQPEKLETSTTSNRTFVHVSNDKREMVNFNKHGVSSSLNSASPPFYPSGAGHDTSILNKGTWAPSHDVPASGKFEEAISPSLQSMVLAQDMCGNNVVRQDKVYVDERIYPTSVRSVSHMQSGSSSQSSHSRGQTARGLAVSVPLPYQPTPPFNQGNKVSSQAHMPALPEGPAAKSPRSTSYHSAEMLEQGFGENTQLQSSPPVRSPVFSDPDAGSPQRSGQSKTGIAGKSKSSSNQSTGRPAFLYNGAQVIGASATVGVAQGGQSFPATPALLPVMQFGGQHHGALSVPAVGMALPGYVARTQLGIKNSEMAWMPVLAGAPSGSLGATYCSPYIAVNGGFYASPSGQVSSSGSTKDASAKKTTNNVQRSPERTEVVNEEFGQRQNKPRRYSEMNFGQ